MKLYGADAMRRVDREAELLGVPARLLMEAAGRAVAEAAIRHWPGAGHPLVLCGKGNNGGDGYVAARYLHLAGRSVAVLELASEPSSEAAGAARAALLAHLPIGALSGATLERALEEADLVVDALFGSGLARPLSGPIAGMVEKTNASGVPILSIDVPSGISADHPVPPGPHVRASLTVQLAAPKLSSALYPARAAYGKSEVAPIGIPEALLDEGSAVALLAPEDVVLPRRPADAHKYTAGTVLVLAGSPRYLGAAELACRGAYRAGAGLVTLAAEARLPSAWPETVFHELDWGQGADALSAIDERRARALLAGPGLDPRALPHLPGLLRDRPVPWVLDATALDPADELREAIANHGRCILTPHAGEAARLLGVSSDAVTADPLAAAAEIARRWNAVAVLKGASTVIADPGGAVSVVPLGHSGMATGGTGDVLAGVIGALLATGGELRNVVEAAVVAHGLAGQLAGRRLGRGMIASDVVEALPAALRRLERKEA